jgi:RNA polymerase sigma factor (TIGR02999 family)
MDPPHAKVTQLLNEAFRAGGDAPGGLLDLVYQQLREIAQQRMNSERRGHTLDATALVHEVYLRLVGNAEVEWANRAHFFYAAAEAMRRILIEHARSRGRLKRGGGSAGPAGRRVSLDVVDLATEANPEEILSVDEAVRRLEARDPDLGRIVRLRFYAGLTEQEAAAALGVTDRTVRRDWALAKAVLLKDLAGDPIA